MSQCSCCLSPQEERIESKTVNRAGRERIYKILERNQFTLPHVDVERAKYFTESMMQTEGEHLTLRWAKALKNVAEKITVWITPDQLLAGRVGKLGRYGILYPEIDGDFYREVLADLEHRDKSPFQISKEDIKTVMEDIAPYWEGKTYHEHLNKAIPAEIRGVTYDDERGLKSKFVVSETSSYRSALQWVPDYEKVIKRGFIDIQNEAKERLAQLDLNNSVDLWDKKPFLEAMIIVCDAIMIWARRHVALARELAAKESDEKRGVWDIKINNLTYTYSAKSPFATQALKGVNLHIGDGEFFGIIGHTGSGKSTLIQHLNALIKLPTAEKKYKPKKVKKGQTPPTMPRLTVGIYDLADKKCDFLSLRADVGMVFQYPEYQLFAETVEDDVAFGLKNFFKDLKAEEVKERVYAALTAVGLDPAEVGEKSPFDLSGGQKRRVAIAGVIVTRPKILILDEPAAGLDPLGKREIMELLHKLHDEWCRTVIIVSHDMDEIACNCTRACVLSDGKIFDCASPHELFSRADELISLGLDVPLTAKISNALKRRGIDIDSDFTPDGFARAVISAFEGGENHA